MKIVKRKNIEDLHSNGIEINEMEALILKGDKNGKV